jgi:hypothetical protein
MSTEKGKSNIPDESEFTPEAYKAVALHPATSNGQQATWKV